ncbi:MAG: metallophosphoesterase [Thermodesulfobacteriota bacterium]|nr:metallophosphoesterase [Thermodesulfobacteriota bacterium]
MPKKKTLFISDIHMGAGKRWDWFDTNTEGPPLIKFFEYVSERYKSRKDIKELVLLGDVFDLWVCPHNEKPHNFAEIVSAQSPVVQAIKSMAAKVPTLYVNGNHDYQVTGQDISKAFDGKVRHLGDVYRRGNILAEHGHRYALFNRPDPKNGAYLRLPLGYYITRLHTSLGENRSAKFNFMLQIIDESFQVMGPEKLPESILDALKDAVDRTHGPNTVDKFNMGRICPDQKYGDVRERYKNLFDDWRESAGFWPSIQMIMCELNRLGTVADQLCRNGVDIVVFGHSHDTKMDKDTWFVKDRIYANCGYWCGFGEQGQAEDNAHWVETDGETVQLYSFKTKQIVKEESL